MIEVKLKDGTKEDICLDRLAISIDRAFKKANIPHASYISQIIAKNSIDRMKKDNDEVIPEYISICTYNTLCDLGYKTVAKVYQLQSYAKK